MADLKTLDVAFLGQPFVNGTTSAKFDLSTLDYTYLGLPFVAGTTMGGEIGPPAVVPSGHLKRVLGIDFAHAKRIGGIGIDRVMMFAGIVH
ncbi:MAG TPA: hypothetical protein VFC67_15360 [Prolixibacteraceae bacterium]|nr:hypothetical protein [Prolixibacteraceae bacterium]